MVRSDCQRRCGGAFMDDEYERLAAALDRLANGFPRTESGVELQLLRRMLTPEEAALAAVMTATPEPVARIAERGGIDPPGRRDSQGPRPARACLGQLEAGCSRIPPGAVRRRQLRGAHADHTRPGFAQLVEEYFSGGGAALMMAAAGDPPRGAGTGGGQVRVGAALRRRPRDPARAPRRFVVGDCVCRVQQDQLGSRRCDFPVKTCLWFSDSEGPGRERRHLAGGGARLPRSRRGGRPGPHGQQRMEGIGYVCNCCGCCCGLLRGITEWGIDHSVAQANYFAEIDPERARVAAVCRPLPGARHLGAETASTVVDRARCIGCGLCVTGCRRQGGDAAAKAAGGDRAAADSTSPPGSSSGCTTAACSDPKRGWLVQKARSIPADIGVRSDGRVAEVGSRRNDNWTRYARASTRGAIALSRPGLPS